MIGGVETYVMLLAQGLAQEGRGTEGGVQLTVATPTPLGANDDAMLPFTVARQPGLPRLFHLIREADVVHLAGPCMVPLALSLALRKPTVVEHHGYQAICPTGELFLEASKTVCPGHFMSRRYWRCVGCNASNRSWPRGLAKVLATFPRRWGCQLASFNLPISHHVKSRLRLPRAKVVYYGIPDLMLQPAAVGGSVLISNVAPGLSPACAALKGGATGKLGHYPVGPGGVSEAPGRLTTFAYVGRLVSEKGLPLLVQAAKRLHDAGLNFRLKVIGDGPDHDLMERLTISLGLDKCVEFTGFLAGEALTNTMSTVDAVVMPSIWEETAGLSAIEQMMRGRLVIASDIGGLGEVVGDGGLKFPPGDIAGLASCLRRVLDDPGLVSALGEKARQRALCLFRVERMVEDHLALYRDLVAPRSWRRLATSSAP